MVSLFICITNKSSIPRWSPLKRGTLKFLRLPPEIRSTGGIESPAPPEPRGAGSGSNCCTSWSRELLQFFLCLFANIKYTRSPATYPQRIITQFDRRGDRYFPPTDSALVWVVFRLKVLQPTACEQICGKSGEKYLVCPKQKLSINTLWKKIESFSTGFPQFFNRSKCCRERLARIGSDFPQAIAGERSRENVDFFPNIFRFREWMRESKGW